jgi:hypothetical protein
VTKEEFEQEYNILLKELYEYDFEGKMIRLKNIKINDKFLKEKAVIFLYSTDIGRDLNNSIRQGESSKKLKAFERTLNYSLTNIKKCPSYKKIYTENFYRGSKINYDGIAEKNVGESFILDNFLSTTYDSTIANIFEQGVKIFIESNEGIYIEQYSESPNEGEVLINTGTYFNIWNKTIKNGIQYIYLDQEYE